MVYCHGKTKCDIKARKLPSTASYTPKTGNYLLTFVYGETNTDTKTDTNTNTWGAGSLAV